MLTIKEWIIENLSENSKVFFCYLYIFSLKINFSQKNVSNYYFVSFIRDNNIIKDEQNNLSLLGRLKKNISESIRLSPFDVVLYFYNIILTLCICCCFGSY